MAGALATTGLLLLAYLEFPREHGAAALAVPGRAARAGPGKVAPDAAAPEQPMSTYTTQFTPGEPRVRNIELAARRLDGHIVEPGETFSFNDVVGPRTRSRGYVPAPPSSGRAS